MPLPPQRSYCPVCRRKDAVIPDIPGEPNHYICAVCIAQTAQDNPRLAVALAFLNQTARVSGRFVSHGDALYSYAIKLAEWRRNDDGHDYLHTSDAFKTWITTKQAVSETTQHHMEALDQALRHKLQKEIHS